VTIIWTHIEESSDGPDPQLPTRVAAAVGEPFHSVVRKHLLKRRTDPSHAFPRFEEHFGRYLFGQLHVPTSVDDGVPEFAELTVIATPDSCWTILRVPTDSHARPTPISDSYRDRLRELKVTLDPEGTVGELLGRLFTITVIELEKVFEATGENIRNCAEALAAVDTKRLGRAMQDRIPDLRDRAGEIRREVASLGTVVDEIESILHRIIDDEIDLQLATDDGADAELLGPATEIHLRDTYYRARRLRLLHDEQLESLGYVFETIALLNDADEVTSGRFLGAIASIMLFPTFIVGLYGMNFETMPELRWPLGYAFAGVLIVGTTIAQVSYFRRKRWL
jgi:magnesium transporter